MFIEFGTFLGVSALVIVTPGQDTALVIRNALSGGWRGGVLTALGVVAGQATWTLCTAAGLTALLMASRPAFTALRFAGAAYLLWLGARSLYRAWSRDGSRLEPAAEHGAALQRPRTALRQGLLSALGNPKLAAFFVSLLPQFVPQGRDSLPALLGLGLVFCAMTLIWLAGYAAAVGRMRHVLVRSGIQRALEAALGVTLVALGFRIAAERR